MNRDRCISEGESPEPSHHVFIGIFDKEKLLEIYDQTVEEEPM